jgi:hypothetical protein
MARTKGAKGKRSLGSVQLRDDETLIPINSHRIRELLTERPLLPLAHRGVDRSQLRRLRDGKQGSMRLGRLKSLAPLLDVPISELIATSGTGETGEAYRIDVTARALADECWRAAGQTGDVAFWLVDMLRFILDYDAWAGAFLDGGTPVLSIDLASGGRGRASALKRLETRRRQFCDQTAALIRLVLPLAIDRRAGVRVNARRAGALLAALRDDFLTRLHGVSHPGTAQTRKIAAAAAARVMKRGP